MNPSATSRTQTSTNTPKSFSALFLLEKGMQCFQQERYVEGIALLSLVSEHLPPDHRHLAPLLETLTHEYARYSDLQQSLREIGQQFTEVCAELKANSAVFRDVQSKLLLEKNNSTTTFPEGADGLWEQATTQVDASHPVLYATCLRPFELRRFGTPLPLCPNRNARALLRYLVAQPGHSATVDKLMTLLWPDDPQNVALRKLYVTVSILRRSLQAGGDHKYILYQSGVYQMNPSIPLSTDVDEFLSLYNQGRKAGRDERAAFYERALTFYMSPFLLEDLYADWSFARREQLRQIYLETCSTLATYNLENHSYETAVHWTSKIIEENRCDEVAHRLLMRIYTLGGRRNDAIRQYQLCVQALRDELNIGPMPETVTLYQALLRGDLK